MDNLFLQAALGLIPAILFFFILSLNRKTHRIRNNLVLLIFVLAAGLLTVLFLKERPRKDAGGQAESVSSLSIVYAAAREGDLALASELLGDLRKSETYDESFTLCAARLYALEGNFKASKILYEKLMGTLPEDVKQSEYTFVALAYRDSRTDTALINYYGSEATGLTPSSGNDAERALTAISGAVELYLAENTDDRESARSAAFIHAASTLYDQYLRTGAFDLHEAEAQLRQMDILERAAPEAFTLSRLRVARLQLQILCEDYKGIAESVNAFSDHNELLIVSELHLNRFIPASYFTDDLTHGISERYGAVAEQLSEVYDRYYSDESRSLRQSVEKLLKSLYFAEQNPALFKVEQGLLSYAASDTAYDASKVYLQLSKIEKHAGNDLLAQEYLDRSLDTVGDCADDNFTHPMYEIIGIISEKDDPERLKEVAYYVEKILTNTMTIEMSDRLTSANSGETQSEQETPAGQYGQFFTDFVSLKRTSINISSVDASAFPELIAHVNIDDAISYSAQELASMLSLSDCGADISDFTIEKVNYESVNILLCCDVSGSMDGDAIENLKKAVAVFVQNRGETEKIALVLFNDGIEAVYGFDSTDAQLLEAAGGLYADGGTNMYGAVSDSLSLFQKTSEEANCIILLSDGEDNTMRSETEILSAIGNGCAAGGITLYSIGLGETVNAPYLDSFARAAGGSYLYVNDSKTLDLFYEYLHNQILNRYVISYQAEDTLRENRLLKASILTDALSYDLFAYSLGSESGSGEAAGDDFQSDILCFADRSVTGLDTRLIFKGNASSQINLLGSGFLETDTVTVSLHGNLDYESDKIPCTFKDDTTVGLTIPAGVACGTYDVHVTINGKKAILDKELTVAVQGSEKTTVFGPYVFTSYVQIKDESSVTLSGCVTLNGWLRFQGDVLLTGDLSASQITLTDLYGGFLTYYKESSEGLAKFLAEKNRTVSLFPLGVLTLYNDPTHTPDSADYRADPVILPLMHISNLFELSAPGLALYPDRIEIDTNAFSTKFPYQDQLLKAGGLTKLFSFEFGLKCLLTNKNIGIIAEYKSESDTKVYTPVNLGAMPIYTSPADFELKLDTLKNNYYIKYLAKVAFIDSDGLGISLTWENSLIPKEVRLYADFEINSTISGVPVTYSDFELGLSDIDVNQSIFDWKLDGSMSVSAMKIGSLLPKLDQWIGDVCVFELQDAKLAFSLGQRYIGVSANLKLFGEITLASVLLEAGNLQYTNDLLNMENEDAFGLHAALMLGAQWESGNCSIDLSGEADLSLTNKLVGLTLTGTADIDLRWWVFEKTALSQGKCIVGVYRDHSGDLVFLIKTRTYPATPESEDLCIAWSLNSGRDTGSKTYL